MTITLYGIKNCDTVKKARTWLDSHRVAFEFHDYKTAGIDSARLEVWCKSFGWEKVLNRAGTTFRALSEPAKQGLDEAKAIKLMVAQPSLIKRPILMQGKKALAIGFKPETYGEIFAG
jgi:arsenate reductase